MGMAQRSIPNPLAHPVRNLYYDLSCRIILSTSCRKRDGLAPRPHVRPFWTKGRREGFRVDFPLTSVQATSQIRPRSESSLKFFRFFVLRPRICPHHHVTRLFADGAGNLPTMLNDQFSGFFSRTVREAS